MLDCGCDCIARRSIGRPDRGRLAKTTLAPVMPVSFSKPLLARDPDPVVADLRSVKPGAVRGADAEVQEAYPRTVPPQE